MPKNGSANADTQMDSPPASADSSTAALALLGKITSAPSTNRKPQIACFGINRKIFGRTRNKSIAAMSNINITPDSTGSAHHSAYEPRNSEDRGNTVQSAADPGKIIVNSTVRNDGRKLHGGKGEYPLDHSDIKARPEQEKFGRGTGRRVGMSALEHEPEQHNGDNAAHSDGVHQICGQPVHGDGGGNGCQLRRR